MATVSLRWEPARQLPWRVLRPGLLGIALLTLVLSWRFPPLYVVVGMLAVMGAVAVSRWPILGFVLLAFSVPWGNAFPLPAASFPVTSTDLLVAILAVAWLVSAVHGSTPFITRIWTPYLVLFLLAITLSASQATDLHASVREIVKWMEVAVIYLTAASLIRTPQQVKLVIAAVVVAGVSQALLGFIQFALDLGPAAFIIHGSFLRAYGTFDQPNPYAGYLNMVIPFGLTMTLVGSRGSARFWYGVATALLVGALLVSESRGALLAGFLAGAVVLGILSSRMRVLVWLGVFVAALGSWLAAYQFLPLGPFERILTVVGLGNVSFGNVTDATFSAVERLAHWVAGLRMFASHPILGVGIGNYAATYPAFHPRGWYAALEHAHNYYINIAAEAGIVGLTAYTLLVGSALWYSCASVRRAQDPLYYAAVTGVTGALIATSFHNLFDVLYVHGMPTLLGLLMALVAVSLRGRILQPASP